MYLTTYSYVCFQSNGQLPPEQIVLSALDIFQEKFQKLLGEKPNRPSPICVDDW